MCGRIHVLPIEAATEKSEQTYACHARDSILLKTNKDQPPAPLHQHVLLEPDRPAKQPTNWKSKMCRRCLRCLNILLIIIRQFIIYHHTSPFMGILKIPQKPPAFCHWSNLEDLPKYFICNLDPLIRYWDSHTTTHLLLIIILLVLIINRL